ncbi:MAG: hypothetical protein H5T72_07065 [Actinobacteria bacterium]|nr:hypothetical protein [Actinomycetota bacterium]
MRPVPEMALAGTLGRDLFAAFIAALAGVAVILYAAASDLFDLKLFKFDPFSLRYPRKASIEYWYVRAARRFQAFLAGGGWNYAKFKKRVKVAFKRDWRRMRRETRRMLPEAARRLNRDIALGALTIAVALVALLIMRLV